MRIEFHTYFRNQLHLLVLLLTEFFAFSLSAWIHEGVVVHDRLHQNVLPVNYFFVQLIDVYGRK